MFEIVAWNNFGNIQIQQRRKIESDVFLLVSLLSIQMISKSISTCSCLSVLFIFSSQKFKDSVHQSRFKLVSLKTLLKETTFSYCWRQIFHFYSSQPRQGFIIQTKSCVYLESESALLANVNVHKHKQGIQLSLW